MSHLITMEKHIEILSTKVYNNRAEFKAGDFKKSEISEISCMRPTNNLCNELG